MPGFGSGPFGTGGFGEWPWSLEAIVEGIPSVYKDQDAEVGQGSLRALLEGMVPSLDGIRRKVRDYDDLRDPLRTPIEQSFLIGEIILRSEDLGDGTSRVFMSEGADKDKYEGVRPGMTLIDFRGFRFIICKILKSALPSDFSDPPIDPATGLATGKHIIVANVGQSRTEFIPFVSGNSSSQENPSVDEATGSIVAVAAGVIVEPTDTFTLDDGVNTALVFEFDTDASVAGANIPVDISTATTDVDVATAMVLAINAATPCNLVASNVAASSATVTIVNPGTGVEGDTTWSETVTDAGFVITQPTGGGPGAFVVEGGDTQVDDGVRTSPYVFNSEGSYLDAPAVDIAGNRVTINWTEGGLQKSGSFTNEGKPGGDLADTSVIDTSVAAVATGQIRIYTDSGAAIDANSITVTYTKEYDATVTLGNQEDAEIRAQNILAFLSNDVGIRLDRNDPEFLQRSYVNSAHKIWDIKGTELGYDVLGQYAGYFVNAKPLYSVIESVALSLPPDTVFQFPAGTAAQGTILAIAASSLFDGETFTLDDGQNLPVVYEFDNVPDGVSPGNVVVNISGAVSATDVASLMVSAINGTGSLNLAASNDGGTSSLVTIVNTVSGVVGNVTWSDSVVDGGFAIGQPSGGVTGNHFTTVDPRRPQFDEVILDAIDLDLLCSEAAFPSEEQDVVATSVTIIRAEGSNKRTEVIVTAALMYESFGTEGTFTDFAGIDFSFSDFERIDDMSYRFETTNFVVPSVGAGTVDWKVFKFEAPNAVTITGLGTDVVDLGRQSVGFTGRRYRITKTFTDPPLADIGNWAFIDSKGVVSYIETFEETDIAGTYEFAIISDVPPASGPANIFLKCEIITDCDFCRASSLLVRISPTTILLYPEALEGDALGRLIIRLEQMIPGHVRIAAFIYDPGPAVAEWGFIAASAIANEYAEDDALYSSFYDEDEFPADEIPADSAPIVATSTIETAATAGNPWGSLTFGNLAIVDGETFILDDGVNPAVTFEFDDDASVVESGVLRRVDVSVAATVDDYKTASIAAITGALTLDITPSDGGTGVVSLINDTAGPAGIVGIVETVTDAGFIADGMYGKGWGAWFNQNIFEEYIDGSDPIVDATWTATGLWHVTEYRSSTQYRCFSYGQNDVGRLGGGGAVAPDYATGAQTTGVLTSPMITDPGAGTSLTLRFRMSYNGRVAPNDVPVVRAVGGVTVTFDRTALGLAGVTSTDVAAWGCIYTEEQASYVDGQTFDLDDGANPVTTFEFDVDGGGVGGGNVAIDISADVTSEDVRDAVIAAINGVGAGLAITASPGGLAEVKLLNDATGVSGNVAITTTGSPPGTFIGMQGGGLGWITFGSTGNIDAIMTGGDFNLEFDFDSVIANAGSEEGWYIDDIEVQFVP